MNTIPGLVDGKILTTQASKVQMLGIFSRVREC